MDLLIHFGYGLPVVRATADSDFAVRVESWAQFNGVKQHLLDLKFTPTESLHRMISPTEIPIDIVPFGGVENGNASIEWPPDGDIIMNIRGFDEALNDAVSLSLSNDPELVVPIASEAGLALMKIIAWTDRALGLRKKDALDLLYLAENNYRLPSTDVYSNDKVLENYGFHVESVGVYLLGRRSREISSEPTTQYVAEFLKGEMADRDYEILIDESMKHPWTSREDNETILQAFACGYLNELGLSGSE